MIKFVFDENGLNIWVKEGISLNVMRKYGISYDPIDNCIIIPTYDDKSNLKYDIFYCLKYIKMGS